MFFKSSDLLTEGEENIPHVNSSGIAGMRVNNLISSDVDKAMASVAKFLDKDFDKLRLIQT